MSAPEMGHRAAIGAGVVPKSGIVPKSPQKCPVMASFETSTDNSGVVRNSVFEAG